MDWPALFAYVAASTGWTWDYIGECLTLPRLYALQKHWSIYPPVHIMAAMWCGYKPATPQKKEEQVQETAAWVNKLPVMKLKRPGNV